MKVFFRTDASVHIGTGHVIRCLTLAEALRDRGCAVEFICRDLEGNLINIIRESRGFPVNALPRSASALADEAGASSHYRWLESDWRLDAEQTLLCLQRGGADWLILDHYALDYRWETTIKPSVGRLFVIDDIADRRHDCDCLLDQNLYDRPESRYTGLVPDGGRLLLGPRFALLRMEFVEARARLRQRHGELERVLVFLGGTDVDNVTGKALEALSAREFRDLTVDIVVGAVNPNREELRRACASRARTAFHVQVGNMAELMSLADLAIGAGGTSTWERCALSLPTLCISIADNQKLLAATAHKHGLLKYLGHYNEVGVREILNALSECRNNHVFLSTLSAASGGLVDGQGTLRTIEALWDSPVAETALSLRPASPSDATLYHAWANDRDVRMNAFNQAPIPWEDHEKWFLAKLEDTGAKLFVMDSGGRPAGQIRFDHGLEGEEIDFSVDREFRGRGLAKKLLIMGTAQLKAGRSGVVAFIGNVKKSNTASANAFLSAGFENAGNRNLKGEECLVFTKTLTG